MDIYLPENITGEIITAGSSTVFPLSERMKQAARVSDYAAMMMLTGEARSGTVIKFDETNKIFTRPSDKHTEVTSRGGLDNSNGKWL